MIRAVTEEARQQSDILRFTEPHDKISVQVIETVVLRDTMI
jgi:hypothetical protein